MRRVLLLLVLLLPSMASAQSFIRYYPPASGSGSAWDGGAFTDPAEGPDGCTNPAYGFGATDTDAGFCLEAANDVRTRIGPNDYFKLDANQFAYIKGGAQVLTMAVGGLQVGSSAGTADYLAFTPQPGGAAAFYGEYTTADLSANRTWTLPDAAGDVAVIASTGFPARTGAQAWAARSITSPSGTLVVGNADGAAGNPTLDVDTAIFPTFASGTASVSGTGVVGTFYFETDRPAAYTYPATNAETVLLSLPAGTGTSGGVPYFTATADVIASSGALTANLPVIGGGAGAAPTVGTRSGNTTAYVTTTGTQTSGDCVEIDANGNHIASGAACGTGGTPEPSVSFILHEEFLTGNATSFGSGSTGFGWQNISSGTNVGVQVPTRFGLWRIASHATNDNSGGSVYFMNSAGHSFGVNATTGDWTLETIFIPGSNGTAITNVAIYFGFIDSNNVLTGTNFDDIIGIRWDSDRSDTTYVFVICNDPTNGCGSNGDDTNQKVVASAASPSAGTATRLKIRRATSGVGGNPTYYFSVGTSGTMESEKTFCSSGCDDTVGTLPTESMVPALIYLTRTTTGVLSADIDYLYFNLSNLARY